VGVNETVGIISKGQHKVLDVVDGRGMVVNEAWGEQEEGRRRGVEEMGRENLRKRKITWKWEGRSKVGGGGGDERKKGGGEGSDDVGNVDNVDNVDDTSFLFKCGVVMDGDDVFGGIRKMIEIGIAKTPLPRFISDAGMAGGDKIRVKGDGSYHVGE